MSRTGDVTAGYRLHLPEIFSPADADYVAFHQAWIRAIRLLPPRFILHKQDWYLLAEYDQSTTLTDFLRCTISIVRKACNCLQAFKLSVPFIFLSQF